MQDIISKPIKIIVFIIILAFYGSLLAHKVELPQGDDMARHIKNGELILKGEFNPIYSNLYSYTEPDHSFINHNWLSNVVFYLIHQSVGWSGLVIFKIIVLLTALTLVFLTALKRANFWLVVVLAIPTILILRERTALRPEIFSYLFIAIFLYFLVDLEDYPQNKKIFWLILVQLLWVNMHLFFIIGTALVGGFLIEKIILNYKNPKNNHHVKKLTILLLGLIAVSFLNPNGWEGALYPLNIFNNYGFIVGENNPPASFLKWRPPLDNISIIFFQWSVFTLALSFLFNLSKKPIFYFLASAATITGGLKMLRLISLFGLMFLPIVSGNLNPIFIRLNNKIGQKNKRNLGNILVVILIVLLTYLIYLGGSGKLSNYRKPGIGLTASSNNGALFFKEQNLKGPIFNDYEMGSYLIYHLYPQEKVFVDNRPEAYSETFFINTYTSAIQSEGGWEQALGRYNFNVIFIHLNNNGTGFLQFMYRRIHDPAWSLVYADSYAIILLRNNKENTEIINRYKITSKNLGKQIEDLISSVNYDDQVAAAFLLGLLDRKDLQSGIYLKIIERLPEKGKIWMFLGMLEYHKNPNLAVTYLEKAIKFGHKTPESYYFLSLAYKNAGENKKAEEILKKVLNIDPTYFDSR